MSPPPGLDGRRRAVGGRSTRLTSAVSVWRSPGECRPQAQRLASAQPSVSCGPTVLQWRHQDGTVTLSTCLSAAERGRPTYDSCSPTCGWEREQEPPRRNHRCRHRRRRRQQGWRDHALPAGCRPRSGRGAAEARWLWRRRRRIGCCGGPAAARAADRLISSARSPRA